MDALFKTKCGMIIVIPKVVLVSSQARGDGSFYITLQGSEEEELYLTKEDYDPLLIKMQSYYVKL